MEVGWFLTGQNSLPKEFRNYRWRNMFVCSDVKHPEEVLFNAMRFGIRGVIKSRKDGTFAVNLMCLNIPVRL
jgi:hypothetical protein